MFSKKAAFVWLAGILVLISASPATAWLEVCNECGEKALVAIARPYSHDGSILTEGWWHIEQGKCLKVIQGTRLSYSTYYLHAHKKGTTGNLIENDEKFCVDPINAFKILDAQKKECRDSAPRNLFDFKKIQISENYDNITYTIRSRAKDGTAAPAEKTGYTPAGGKEEEQNAPPK
jgi:uncharacterized membrane protein